MLKHNIYPAYPVTGGALRQGYPAIADAVRTQPAVWVCDGASAVDWESFHAGLQTALAEDSHAVLQANFLSIQPAHIGADAGRALLESYLEIDDPSYGRLYDGSLADFFDPSRMGALAEEVRLLRESGNSVVVYGTGSSLLPLAGLQAKSIHTVWVDLPYETIRSLSELKEIPSLAGYTPLSEKFLTNLDYPVLDRQRAALLPGLAIYVDFSSPQDPLILSGAALRSSLHHLAQAPFRVVPAVYTSMWGGQYLVSQVPGLKEKPRCSHFYSLFPPVNSLLLDGDGLQIELPFELLMHLESKAVQGLELSGAFASRMPVRFTLMDTLGGQTLSHQIHPGRSQARSFFNTDFDEPETYFLLDTAPGGLVYLGLRDDSSPGEFRRSVERAQDEQIGFELGDYVNTFPTRPGMAIHVPARMVHNAGANNLILEVTTHPIGHTYRIYDFMRRTGDGKLRPLHVKQAFTCLDEKRNRSWIDQKGLFMQPKTVAQGEDWQVRRLSSPPLTKFVNDEITFTSSYADTTGGESFHLLLSVQGDDLRLEGQGFSHPLHQYELIIIPAAAGEYRLVNDEGGPCRVFKVYVSSLEEYLSAEL